MDRKILRRQKCYLQEQWVSDDSDNDDEGYNENIEVVVFRCCSKQALLKISQVSQEITSVGVFS